MNKTGHSLWAVDVIKVIAAQSILIHHMVAYGPMSWTLYPSHTALFDWIFEYGRMAVQAFLVVGGFLAARSLVPRPGEIRVAPRIGKIWELVRARYVRLAPPYILALLLTMASALVVRSLINDSDTPHPATWGQLLAHVFFVQDIVGIPALTAGAWYVAIDLQLYALLAVLLYASQVAAHASGTRSAMWVATAVVGLSMASLLWLNFHEDLDDWAPYFFGAYGLGILVQWEKRSTRSPLWAALTAAMVALALWIQWRERIAVAAFTALMLVLLLGRQATPSGRLARIIRVLSEKSYTLFLVHYMVILLVGGIVTYFWPAQTGPARVGMAVVWCLSMVGSWALSHLTDLLMTRWH